MSIIEESKVGLKTAALMIVGAMSLTATVSSVYHGIVYNAKRVEYVNERIDTKTGRIEEEVSGLDDRVRALEKFNKDMKDGN